MNLSDLTAATEWIRAMDSDAELQVDSRGTLWMTFCGDAESIMDSADVMAVDVNIQGEWKCWDDASDEEIVSADLFRWIVLTV